MGILNSLLFLFFTVFSLQYCQAVKKSYVVYLGAHSHLSEPSTLDINAVTDSHHELLSSYLGSKEKAKEAIFLSYTHYINGFAAKLEDKEAAELSKHPKVVSVFPNQVSELHTTRSWEFLGLERNGEIPTDSIWQKATFGEGIIIGNLDSGVWPESKSFNDEGIGLIPSRWKGYCDTNDGVKCNRKLIGARYFNKSCEPDPSTSCNTARDYDGHGTHTLSTAAGRFVPGSNLLGSANGTAKGGSPNARVASYKVCWQGCGDIDMLAAFDAAIHDRVDILSVSIGSRGPRPRKYLEDALAIGSLHAVMNGVIVVASAGNEGPDAGTVKNVAPWILTVGSSTIDRNFPSNVILGNKQQFKGLSFNTNSLPAGKYHPLVYSVDAKAASASSHDAEFCLTGSLDPVKVKGKIVYCTRNSTGLDEEKSWEVAQAYGVGMILADDQLTNVAIFPRPRPHFVPTSAISAEDGLSILSYIRSTRSPVAYIIGGTQVGNVVAPIMASSSSTGPNAITPQILKPDITAPGVNILAAYTEATGPSNFPLDRRHFPFNIISGTSMSCPHVSGIVGLLKTMHAEWSPAAIKSAIMTTARTTNNIGQPIANVSLVKANPFNYGAGHIQPNSAMDPGLVYDLNTTDYFNFLCSVGYNSTLLMLMIREPYKCPSSDNNLLDFNYPSITVPNLSGKVTLSRTLKNVGAPSLYKVHFKAPNGISVKVEPTSLKFNKIYEEKTFKITLEAKESSKDGQYVFGKLRWSDGEHDVRSPIVVGIGPTDLN